MGRPNGFKNVKPEDEKFIKLFVEQTSFNQGPAAMIQGFRVANVQILHNSTISVSLKIWPSLLPCSYKINIMV